MVADHVAREAGQDRRQGGPARSVRHLSACRDRDSTAVVRRHRATDRRPAAAASTDMTPYVIAAVGLNRRAPGLATRRTAVFSHPIALWPGLGSTECPIPSRQTGLIGHASDRFSIVLPSSVVGRNNLGNTNEALRSPDTLHTSVE